MAACEPTWTEEQRRRWTRENAWLYVRPDAARFFKPGTDLSFLPKSPEQERLDAKRARLLEEAEAERAAADSAGEEAERKQLEREHLRLEWMVADLRLHLVLKALREKRGESLVRKYSSDQPRVPAGNPDGGQWTSGGGAAQASTQSTTGETGGNDPRVLSDANPDNTWVPGAQYADATPPAAGTGDDSRDKPGWHDYTSGPNLVCPAELQCSREELADQMARYSVPGQDPSKPINSNTVNPVYAPGGLYVGDVRTVIAEDGLAVTNRTQPGHLLFDGQVAPSATQASDGSWYVTTRGIGNNVLLGINYPNQWIGPEIFSDLDRQLRRNIEAHRGKSSDASQRRIAGRPGGRAFRLGEWKGRADVVQV